MLKIKNDLEWKKEQERMIHDIGTDLRDSLRDEISNKGYGTPTSDKLEFFEDDKVVGSEEFSIAVMDSGRLAGEYPPFDKIADWVRYVKDDGANASSDERTITAITWKVMNKIKDEGIEPSWFVKNVLEDFTA